MDRCAGWLSQLSKLAHTMDLSPKPAPWNHCLNLLFFMYVFDKNFLWRYQGVKVGTLGRQNEGNRSYVRLDLYIWYVFYVSLPNEMKLLLFYIFFFGRYPDCFHSQKFLKKIYNFNGQKINLFQKYSKNCLVLGSGSWKMAEFPPSQLVLSVPWNNEVWNGNSESSAICQYVCQSVLFVQPIRSFNLISMLVHCLHMKITTCLLVLINQLRKWDNSFSCELVSSLSAYESCLIYLEQSCHSILSSSMVLPCVALLNIFGGTVLSPIKLS